MLLESKYICEKGSAPVNEDIAKITRHGAWVLDGATGLNNRNLVDENSDAKWYVTWWNNYLKENLYTNKSLQSIIRQGITEVKKEFTCKSHSSDIRDIDKPSCSFFVLRWNDDKTKIEYCGLGDCMLIIKTKDSINKYYDKKLSNLDDMVLTKLGNILNSQSITHSQAKEIIMDDIITNRLKKNKPNGYYILGFAEEAADYMMHGEIDINQMTDILILSDGFYALFEKYKYITIENFIKELQTGNSNLLLKALRDTEENDIDTKTYPRFKVSDDASLVYLQFEK